MFKKIGPHLIPPREIASMQYPHCDKRILHAPQTCELCDGHKEWQALRIAWGIAFTGYTPEGDELPCPADHARGDGHTAWEGNRPKPVRSDQGQHYRVACDCTEAITHDDPYHWMTSCSRQTMCTHPPGRRFRRPDLPDTCLLCNEFVGDKQ